MTSPAAATHDDAAAVLLWQLLSVSLSTPTRDSLEQVDALASALERDGGPGAATGLREAIAASSAEEVAAAQERLFGGKVAVAPYEGSYEDDPFRQARQMADVAGFYRAFGAEAHGPAHERPDHAGCELEFLAFLGVRKLAAVEAGHDAEADLCREIEEAFLSDHAGRWLPAFFRALQREAADGFHRALGRLGADGIASELERRGVQPAPLGPRARRLSVEADELACASGAEAVTPLLPGGRRGRTRA